LQIRGTFEDNNHEFNHGVSAGYFSDMVEGRLEIDATFRRNKASDGAAIHIFRPVFTAYVTINGLFEDNEAIELGTGSRGGAIRFQNVEAPVLITGIHTTCLLPGCLPTHSHTPYIYAIEQVHTATTRRKGGAESSPVTASTGLAAWSLRALSSTTRLGRLGVCIPYLNAAAPPTMITYS
jgi:hypothetical protein